MKKTLKLTISLLLALILLLCMGVACSKKPNVEPTTENTDKQPSESNNEDPADPDAPVYTGMTVAEFDATNATLAATAQSSIIQLNSITQLTENSTLSPDVYQDTDIITNINFDNPKNFEILSFTINDTKYSSYMFEKGSTMSNILVKTNVGNTWGEKSYTIAAVKYIEDTEIKDVVMQGDQTTKVNVYGLEKTETVDQLTYKFYSNKTATLTAVPKSLEEVIIPSYVNEYKITSMDDNTFKAHYACHTLVYIPETIKAVSKAQFFQGGESRVVYVLGTTGMENLGCCLSEYDGVAREDLVQVDDCYYIISEQGATLVRYVGDEVSTYTVPNTITVNDTAVTVIEVKRSAFLLQCHPADLICEYVFNP